MQTHAVIHSLSQQVLSPPTDNDDLCYAAFDPQQYPSLALQEEVSMHVDIPFADNIVELAFESLNQ